jgi:Holliday junction resolvasome RuvABC endonuclease subunit
MTTILGLDISSTYLGWCCLPVGQRPVARSIALGSGDIADRCAKAQQEVSLLLAACAPDAVAIEQWVWRFPNTTIPQVLVQGAVLAELGALGLAYTMVQPSEAKRALAGCGSADKAQMLRAAAWRFGHDPLFLEIEQRRGLWAAWMNHVCIYDEHSADALGIALSAVGRVEVCEVDAL